MKLFGMDSPLYKTIEWLSNLVKVSVLWSLTGGAALSFVIQVVSQGNEVVMALAYLPFIMMGPATVACAYITNQMVEELEGEIAKTFFRVYRENIKKGIPLGLIFLVGLYAIYLDFQYFNNLEEHSFVFLVMGMLGIFIVFMSFIYAFHLMSRYENTLWKTIRNSYDIATRYFLRTLALFGILVAEVCVIFWNTTTIFFGLLGGIGLISYTISGFAMRFFREIEKRYEENGEG